MNSNATNELLWEETHVAAYLVRFSNGRIEFIPFFCGDEDSTYDAAAMAPKMMSAEDADDVTDAFVVVGLIEDVMQKFQPDNILSFSDLHE